MSLRNYDEIIREYFDLTNYRDLKILNHINEADQNKVLESLTSKLYKSIMDKVDDIDFGTIPNTKGDITKLQNYDQLIECINVIKQILVEYRQDLTPVTVIQTAISNVQQRKDMFEKAFAFKLDLPILLYNTIVLSIVSSVSLIIATSIEFIKDAGSQEYSIKFDKVAYVRSKDNILYQNLVRFNNACANGQVDACIEHVIKSGSKQLMGVDTLTIVGVAAVIGIIANIIPIMRELVFFFYHAKQSISDYFEIQADLLAINAEYVKNNSLSGRDASERKEIAKKQSKIADQFRKIGNALAIDAKTSEAKATKDVKDSERKYSLNEITPEKLDSAEQYYDNGAGSSIF